MTSSRRGERTRTQLVRAIAQALSSDVPLEDVWMRCCAPLKLMMKARGVIAVARDRGEDRVAYSLWDDGDVAPTSDAVPPLARRAMESLETEIAGAGELCRVCVPIRFGSAVLGALFFERATRRSENIASLETCALYIGARLHQELTLEETSRLARLAHVDALTGIANRRLFDERIVTEWQHAASEDASLGILMLDLDHFKAFNDTYGHQAGDLCLQQVARALQDCCKRPGDLVARYGGEEFVALLPGVDPAGAVAIAERLRTSVADLNIAHAGTSAGYVSVSVGAVSCTPRVDNVADALHAADEALYTAKVSGRNRAFSPGFAVGPAVENQRLVRERVVLPLQLTAFIGRSNELERLREQMRVSRMLTITGVGGNGKTRIAVEASARESDRYASGVRFADLAPLQNGDLVVSTIANLFDSRAGDIETLVRDLHDTEALLVLDNCEHVIGEVAAVAGTLLRRCASLRILATSREPLSIAGERVFRLPLLATPEKAESLDVNAALAFDAVALFADRAAAANPDFALTVENVGAVATICRRVDGIALAIELVASRIGSSGASELAEHVDRQLQLLVHGDRAALPRQRTMRALIDWSYDSLPPNEQAMFRRLSLLRGTFSFDVATELCGDAAADPMTSFEALSSLIRKSLVVEEPALGSVRYRLLESMREYASEKLAESGELFAETRRHAGYFLDVAAHLRNRMRKESPRQWMDDMIANVDNFRAALEWSLSGENDISLGIALTVSAAPLFYETFPAESAQWLRAAVRAFNDDVGIHDRAQLHALLCTQAKDMTAVQLRAHGEEAIALFRQTDDREGLCEALRVCAQCVGWYFHQDRAYADKLACEAIEIARTLDKPALLAIALRTRGLTIDMSDFPSKRKALEEALALIRVHGNERHIGSTLSWISDFEFSAGEELRAYAYGREAVGYAEASGSNEVLATTLCNLSQYAVAAEDWDVARIVAARCIELCTRTGQSLYTTFALQALAMCCAHNGDTERAARLIGFCDARVGVAHVDRQADQSEDLLYRRFMAHLRTIVPEDVLSREMARGAAMNEAEAIAQAVSIN